MWETLKIVDPFFPAPFFPTKKYDICTSNHMVWEQLSLFKCLAPSFQHLVLLEFSSKYKSWFAIEIDSWLAWLQHLSPDSGSSMTRKAALPSLSIPTKIPEILPMVSSEELWWGCAGTSSNRGIWGTSLLAPQKEKALLWLITVWAHVGSTGRPRLPWGNRITTQGRKRDPPRAS